MVRESRCAACVFEVYRFAEEHPAVEDSLVIGERITSGKRAGDVRIVLFVKLADGVDELTPALEKEIKASAVVVARLRGLLRLGARPAGDAGFCFCCFFVFLSFFVVFVFLSLFL